MKKLLIFFFICQSSAFASHSPIVVDTHLSPYAGSYDSLSVQEEILNLQNKYKGYLLSNKQAKFEKAKEDAEDASILSFPPKLSTGKRILGRTLRLGELAFFWTPLNSAIATTQHEVFGHGYRIREVGRKNAKVSQYKIGLPYPYGSGGGATYFYMYKPLYPSENLLISIAGTEANTILGQRATLSWLSKNNVDGREASLRTEASNDLPVYIISLLGSLDSCLEGHDIFDYLKELYSLYPCTKDPADELTSLVLKSALTIGTDPFNYYGLASQIRYFWSGLPVKMTRLNTAIRFFAPVYRISLTPFGPENIFGNYLLFKKGGPSYFYFKQGEFSKNKYYGFGFENHDILSFGAHKMGLKLDFWSQPQLILFYPQNSELSYKSSENVSFKDDRFDFECAYEYTDSELFSKQLGSAFSIIYQYTFPTFQRSSLFSQIGFKTAGYLPGETYRGDLILRLGANLIF
ncbi:MAG: hypothetical protein S4CHLAM7_01290 [Chlamydiae bacterium]|nr:hypothetical protein [Chlamydiota bacterium]